MKDLSVEVIELEDFLKEITHTSPDYYRAETLMSLIHTLLIELKKKLSKSVLLSDLIGFAKREKSND